MNQIQSKITAKYIPQLENKVFQQSNHHLTINSLFTELYKSVNKSKELETKNNLKALELDNGLTQSINQLKSDNLDKQMKFDNKYLARMAKLSSLFDDRNNTNPLDKEELSTIAEQITKLNGKLEKITSEDYKKKLDAKLEKKVNEYKHDQCKIIQRQTLKVSGIKETINQIINMIKQEKETELCSQQFGAHKFEYQLIKVESEFNDYAINQKQELFTQIKNLNTELTNEENYLVNTNKTMLKRLNDLEQDIKKDNFDPQNYYDVLNTQNTIIIKHYNNRQEILNNTIRLLEKLASLNVSLLNAKKTSQKLFVPQCNNLAANTIQQQESLDNNTITTPQGSSSAAHTNQIDFNQLHQERSELINKSHTGNLTGSEKNRLIQLDQQLKLDVIQTKPCNLLVDNSCVTDILALPKDVESPDKYEYTRYIDRCLFDFDKDGRVYNQYMFGKDFVNNCKNAAQKAQNLDLAQFKNLELIHNELNTGKLSTLESAAQKILGESYNQLESSQQQIIKDCFLVNATHVLRYKDHDPKLTDLVTQDVRKNLKCKNFIPNNNVSIQFDESFIPAEKKLKYAEYYDGVRKQNGQFFIHYYQDENEINLIYTRLYTNLQKLIDRASSNDEKIAAILIFTAQLEASHFFSDANTRLVFGIIFPKLLQKYQLADSILYIPNGMSDLVASLLVQLSQEGLIENYPINSLCEALGPAINWVKEGQDYCKKIKTVK